MCTAERWAATWFAFPARAGGGGGGGEGFAHDGGVEDEAKGFFKVDASTGRDTFARRGPERGAVLEGGSGGEALLFREVFETVPC
jgi:hypothetical protein